MWPFCWFSLWFFRSLQSTADPLTTLSDRIARAFNRSWATQTVALNISKAFDRVWHPGLLHKGKSYGISGQIFYFIFSLFLEKVHINCNKAAQIKILANEIVTKWCLNLIIKESKQTIMWYFLLYFLIITFRSSCWYDQKTEIVFNCSFSFT